MRMHQCLANEHAVCKHHSCLHMKTSRWLGQQAAAAYVLAHVSFRCPWPVSSSLEVLQQHLQHALAMSTRLDLFPPTCTLNSSHQLSLFCRLIDTVATLSMLLDIPAIVNGLNSVNVSSHSVENDEVSFLARGTSNTSANKARQIMRVCRILRLMRLVYLYNPYELHKQVCLALLCFGTVSVNSTGVYAMLCSVSDLEADAPCRISLQPV